ncbi:hypothetical protein Tco_0321594 [Tanacetum coccineum]
MISVSMFFGIKGAMKEGITSNRKRGVMKEPLHRINCKQRSGPTIFQNLRRISRSLHPPMIIIRRLGNKIDDTMTDSRFTGNEKQIITETSSFTFLGSSTIRINHDTLTPLVGRFSVNHAMKKLGVFIPFFRI